MPQTEVTLKIGAKAPDFSLPAVDGKTYSLTSFPDKKALVVIFSCNHCPYVQAYEDRMIAIQKDYQNKGAQLIAINSNDATRYPEDSFDNMVKRAKAKGFNFPYLCDESQQVAAAYGAIRTPHIFLLDGQHVLRYTGRIDDNWQQPEVVKSQDLRLAIEDILAGKEVSQPETYAIGCTIKWADRH